ncbi:hypothetical protein BJ546DRAFT_951733 [Cryomyces antarcticus]|nr:hypothetical protein LTR60_000964 [Cryomyces antarcticus]
MTSYESQDNPQASCEHGAIASSSRASNTGHPRWPVRSGRLFATTDHGSALCQRIVASTRAAHGSGEDSQVTLECFIGLIHEYVKTSPSFFASYTPASTTDHLLSESAIVISCLTLKESASPGIANSFFPFVRPVSTRVQPAHPRTSTSNASSAQQHVRPSLVVVHTVMALVHSVANLVHETLHEELVTDGGQSTQFRRAPDYPPSDRGSKVKKLGEPDHLVLLSFAASRRDVQDLEVHAAPPCVETHALLSSVSRGG